MKVSLFKSLLVVAATVVLFASCSPKQESVRVGLDATAPSFANGKVDLIVALSGQSATNVGVTLTASGSIPASSLTFEKNPSIPAGTTSKTVSVTVDESTLEPGDYEATFSISSVTGADINVAKQSVTVKLTVEAPVIIPDVSIPSYSEAFDNNKASFKVALTQAIDSDVVVNFEVKTDLGEYEAVPAEALTFTNPVTIAAGATEVDVEVILDATAVPKGVSAFAVIAIASVSENAKIASRKVQTYIEAYSEIVANLRSDWSVSFGGEYEQNGTTYHLIEADGMGDDGTYYIFIYDKGTVESAFPEGLTAYIQYAEEEIVGPYIGTDDAYQIKQGETGWLYRTLSVGEYEIWLLGCTPSGHITGDYTTSTFAIEASAEELSAYEKWLGEWNVTRKTVTDKWVITQKYAGGSFYIQGIDGGSSTISDILVEAEYDAANDQILISTQDCKEWNYQGVKYIISLMGFTSKGIVSGDFGVAKIKKTGENSATIESGGKVTLSDGNSYDVTGMTFFASDGSGSGYVFNNQIFYTWPETMSKIVANNDDPVYNSYLGEWTITREDSEWDSEAKTWKPLGEVTDVWEITPKIAGNSFYISGIEGFSDVVIEASYNAADGTFTVKEQDLTVGEYTLCFVGIFHYPGDASNEEGDYIWDSSATLFTASKSGDVITLTEGAAGSYGNFLSMQLFLYDDGYYAEHDEGYALPNTLNKATASAGAPRFAKRAGTPVVSAFKAAKTSSSQPLRRATLSARNGRMVERNASVR